MKCRYCGALALFGDWARYMDKAFKCPYSTKSAPGHIWQSRSIISLRNLDSGEIEGEEEPPTEETRYTLTLNHDERRVDSESSYTWEQVCDLRTRFQEVFGIATFWIDASPDAEASP